MTTNSPTDELFSILDFLRWTVSELTRAQVHYGHGTDNAWDEALALVLTSLAIPLTLEFSPELLHALVTQDERELLIQRIAQRTQQRIPTPYITQQSWFAGLPFYVDERVLIPRSPLAETISAGFAPWHTPQAITRVLDLCTGSGSLAIASAYALPDAEIIASDIDSGALEVAQRNVTQHGLQAQVQLQQSDLFENINGRFDVIISNPPYVPLDEYASLPTEYTHEPRLALAAGEDGLSIVDRLLAQAADYLTPDGILLVEVGNTQVMVAERYAHLPLIWLEFENGGEGVFMLTAQQLQGNQE